MENASCQILQWMPNIPDVLRFKDVWLDFRYLCLELPEDAEKLTMMHSAFINRGHLVLTQCNTACVFLWKQRQPDRYNHPVAIQAHQVVTVPAPPVAECKMLFSGPIPNRSPYTINWKCVQQRHINRICLTSPCRSYFRTKFFCARHCFYVA